MNSETTLKSTRTRQGISIFAGLAVLVGLSIISHYNYLFFHSLAELFSIVVACCIFILTWHLRRIIENGYLIFIGIAYLFIAVFDMLHLLTFSGMHLLTDVAPDISTQLWVAGRLMESLAFFAAAFIRKRPLQWVWPFAAIFGTLSAFLILMIFYWRIFPTCFRPGVGLTDFKIITEYVIVAILVAAAFILVKRGSDFEPHILRLIVASILVTAMSELAFTLYHSPQGIANQLGHHLKIISYYLIFRAIITTGISRPFDLLFLNTKKAVLEKERLLEEQVKAKLEAEKMSAQHKAILDGITEGLTILGPEGELLEINATAMAFYEIDSADECPEDLEAFASLVKLSDLDGRLLTFPEWPLVRVQRGEMFTQYEVQVQNRVTGKDWIASYNGAPVYNGLGDHIYSVVTIRDITRQKEIQQELRYARDDLELRIQQRTAELMQANENLKEFVYVASHDLQDPLRKIAYFGSRLQELPQANLDEKGKDFLARLLKAIQRMQLLIESLLEYSRTSSKDINFTKVDLNDIVRGVVEDMEPYIHETNGRVTWDRLPVVMADGIQMHQLFQNLIGNALKFNTRAEKWVHCRTQRLDYHQPAGKSTATPWHQICVEDNGVGFDPAYAKDIFLPFQRLYNDTDFEGTGIGLAICKKIVDRHGGTIMAANRHEGGAVFTITLPENSQ